MDLVSIVAEPGPFIGREVSVDGFIVVGGDSRLVAYPEWPDGPAILLPHPVTMQRLLERVPASGGGPHIYLEDSTVVGVMADGPLRFVSVRLLVVWGDHGQQYQLHDVAW